MTDLDRIVGGLSCRDVLALLPEFVEGELAPEVLARATEHLGDCDTCEKFGGEYGKLVVFLRAAHARAPLDEGVRTRLAERMARLWTEESQ